MKVHLNKYTENPHKYRVFEVGSGKTYPLEGRQVGGGELGAELKDESMVDVGKGRREFSQAGVEEGKQSTLLRLLRERRTLP